MSYLLAESAGVRFKIELNPNHRKPIMPSGNKNISGIAVEVVSSKKEEIQTTLQGKAKNSENFWGTDEYVELRELARQHQVFFAGLEPIFRNDDILDEYTADLIKAGNSLPFRYKFAASLVEISTQLYKGPLERDSVLCYLQRAVQNKRRALQDFGQYSFVRDLVLAQRAVTFGKFVTQGESDKDVVLGVGINHSDVAEFIGLEEEERLARIADIPEWKDLYNPSGVGNIYAVKYDPTKKRWIDKIIKDHKLIGL